ncbi:MAG: DegT/DnrJ/EryC1/StrS family aminotransferase [Bacteroidota bacterium]
MTTKSKEIRMVDTITQYHHIKDEVDAAVSAVVASGMYINGPAVKQFRASLGEYLGASKVIACGNGTDALQVALMALDLAPGDEVITSPFTFFATAEVIALLGLVPVFVDIETDTYNLDPTKIEAAITDRTRCIMPVHLFGHVAHMEPIMELAEQHKLYVIEDAAQSIGADYIFSDGRRQKAGLVGHIGCTSFYPSKNLGAYGDAGAIYTNDEALGDRCQIVCNHGSHKRYHHSRIGVNSRLDSIQAAILDVKLRHLDAYNHARQTAAATYDELLAGVDGLIRPHRAPYQTHVFHQYTLRVEEGRAKRDAIQAQLRERSIPSMVYYPIPLHLQEAYAPYGFKHGDMPVAEQYSAEVISLPMHSELDREQLEYIAQNFLDVYHKN